MRMHRDRAFASLHHVLELQWMLEAYRTTRKDGAMGNRRDHGRHYAGDLEASSGACASGWSEQG